MGREKKQIWNPSSESKEPIYSLINTVAAMMILRAKICLQSSFIDNPFFTWHRFWARESLQFSPWSLRSQGVLGHPGKNLPCLMHHPIYLWMYFPCPKLVSPFVCICLEGSSHSSLNPGLFNGCRHTASNQCSLIQQWLGPYYMPAAVLGSGDTRVMDTHRAPDLRYNSVREISRKMVRRKRGECLGSDCCPGRQ